jgi:ArsR family transcriptional regulator
MRNESEAAALAKALGHPVRVRIVRLLMAKDGASAGEVAAAFPLAQSTISEHLRILRESHLINLEPVGPRSLYRIDVRVLKRFQVLIAEI